jgi:hypothetical protein
MFENYTQEARVTVFNGRVQASLFGSDAVEVGHLFLGLIQGTLRWLCGSSNPGSTWMTRDAG